ncbi:hypothetical protein V6N13_099178 [Hibiscus sabdariffa]|uniref:Uncharacterized protein n=1 Tax=Hibiscus sabdariffa TaxID=183260 RepID=A0ABR2PYV7_9ROSI
MVVLQYRGVVITQIALAGPQNHVTIRAAFRAEDIESVYAKVPSRTVAPFPIDHAPQLIPRLRKGSP